MYGLFQMAIRKYDGSSNPVTVEKIQYVSTQMAKLMQETSTKLNPIYLYYDFTDIDKKYNVVKSARVINEAFVLIGQIQQHIAPIPATNEKELEAGLFRYQAAVGERREVPGIDCFSPNWRNTARNVRRRSVYALRN